MPKKKKHPKVYIQDWIDFHPYERPAASDFFYLRVCNLVSDVLHRSNDFLIGIYPKDEEHQEFACVLVAMFEDIISGTGIWKAFISKHHQLYGKYLPFYNLDDYYPDEINPQDVTFMVWYYLSIVFDDKYILSPDSFTVVGMEVYKIFDAEWENAPVNTQLKNFLHVPHDETDFYAIRYKMDWLILSSYLFHFKGMDCTHEKIKILEERKDKTDKKEFEEALNLTKEIHDSYVIDSVSDLLALRGKDWFAYVLGEDHPLYHHLLNMSDKKSGKYLYLGHDDKDLHFKHLGSGIELKVTKKSLDKADYMKKDETILMMSVVNWMGEWWFSGVLAAFDITDEILLDEVANPINANVFSDEEKKKEFLLEQYECFMKFSQNKQLLFFNNGFDLQDFVNGFISFYQEQAAKKRPGQSKGLKTQPLKAGKFADDDKMRNESWFLFFNPASGIELAYSFNNIIPDKDNPNYKKDYDWDHVMDLLIGKSYSKEFIEYLVDNYEMEGFQFPHEATGDMLIQNLDFMLRFWKRENYYAKPRLTLV